MSASSLRTSPSSRSATRTLCSRSSSIASITRLTTASPRSASLGKLRRDARRLARRPRCVLGGPANRLDPAREVLELGLQARDFRTDHTDRHRAARRPDRELGRHLPQIVQPVGEVARELAGLPGTCGEHGKVPHTGVVPSGRLGARVVPASGESVRRQRRLIVRAGAVGRPGSVRGVRAVGRGTAVGGAVETIHVPVDPTGPDVAEHRHLVTWSPRPLHAELEGACRPPCRRAQESRQRARRMLGGRLPAPARNRRTGDDAIGRTDCRATAPSGRRRPAVRNRRGAKGVP